MAEKQQTNRMLPLLTLLLAAGQIVIAALPGFGIGTPVGDRTGYAQPPEVPAGYAFSIWGLIFLLSVIYAVRGLIRPGNMAAGALAPALFGLAILWMALAQFGGPNGALVPVIWLMLATACLALTRSAVLSGLDRWLSVPLFGLYAGWLTAAAPLNTSTLLRDWGLAPFGLEPWAYGACVALVALVLGLVLLFRARAGLWYGAALIWAFAAIVIRHWGDPALQPLAFAALSAGGVTLIATVLSLRRMGALRAASPSS